MTPQELKASILQLAVQGKLVEQRSEEGTGEELFQQIQAEKQRLIKAGTIKKEKTLPEIAEDEIPFDIPKSWKWVRIGSLLHKLVDGTHRTPKYTTSGVPFVSVRNMSDGRLSLEDTKFISEKEHRELWSRCNPQRGDILLSKVGTTGVPAKVNTDEEFSLFVSVALLKFNNDLLDIDFLIYSILAPDFQKQCQEHTRGVGNKNWVIVDIANTVMPFPPLAEQKRIVAKIEELLPYIDRYEQAWSKLEEFNKRFPVDMQKSILQMAIQGKLVEQHPEEGTGEELYQQIQSEKQRLINAGTIKKEKPLPEIADDEIPFDIPESWKWCRLSELTILENGDRSSKYPVDTDYVNFGIPFFGAKDMSGRYMSFENVRYISETKFKELGNGKLHDNDFICLLRGSVGKISQFKIDENHKTGFICAQMVIIRSVSSTVIDYLYTVMTSPYYFSFIESKTTGTAVRQLPAKELGNILIPLPPLAEQKRIVAKLEEILPLCEKLK